MEEEQNTPLKILLEDGTNRQRILMEKDICFLEGGTVHLEDPFVGLKEGLNILRIFWRRNRA